MMAAALMAGSSAGAFAQASYSGYFLDNYVNRYQLNPAMTDAGKTGYVAFPMLGNMNIGMMGNIHTSSLIYNRNVGGIDKTVLFTSPLVSTDEFMKNVHDMNKLGLDLKLDILGVGFKVLGGESAVSLSLVTDANIGVPGSLFSLMKEGVENKNYDIKNFRINASAYGQIQLNHAREIKQVPGLKVGAAVKFLIGLANVDAYFNRAELELGENAWSARTDADIYTNLKGLKYTTTTNDYGDRYVDGVDMDGFGVNGFGLGFDLGATYKWRDFNFSLSLLDLGFISWSNTQYATTGGLKEVSTDSYIFTPGDSDSDDQWHDLQDNIEKLYQLEDRGDIGGRTRGLRATLNWGVEYTLPYYRRLTFGMVNNTRFNGSFTHTDFRFSANVNPVDCLSASANFVAGTYGVGFGWLLNLNLKGFSLYVGMDRTLGKLAKQGVPLNSNANVNFGLNFPF